MITPYYNNPFTTYEDGFEVVNKLNRGEYRVMTNERLGELLEAELKLEKIEKILGNIQNHNSITCSN